MLESMPVWFDRFYILRFTFPIIVSYIYLQVGGLVDSLMRSMQAPRAEI